MCEKYVVRASNSLLWGPNVRTIIGGRINLFFARRRMSAA